MNKKKIGIGIVICFVLLVILIFIMNIEKKSQNEGNIDSRTAEGQLLLSGISVFSEKYIGSLESTEIIQQIQEMIKVDIPELHKNIKKIDENKLGKYYEENKNELKDKFGIQNEDEFKKFATKINGTKIDLNTWYKLKVNRESFIIKSEKPNYSYVEFDVQFENGEKMSFSIYIANRVTMSPRYILTAL